MDLKSNIIKEKNFRWLVLLLLSLCTLFIIWTGIQEHQNFQSVFNGDSAPAQKIETFKIGNLTLSKASVSQNEESQITRYVTAQELTYKPSENKIDSILKANRGLTKMIGLTGPPSFMITNENEGFWKSQFYLEFGFRVGGLLILSILFIVITEINFRQEKKLFTTEIKWLFVGIFFLVFAGYLIDAILYGRMMHFLNETYFLGESLTGGLSGEFMFVIVALLFVIIFLERAIPMQKEQDLTV